MCLVEIGAQAQEETAACERIFRRYGLPMLVEDHSNRRDVFGRAAPVLLLLFLAGIIGSANLAWPWWQNVLAIVGASAFIALGYVGVNILRGRPWSTLPQDVGGPELAFFVLAPAVPPLVAGWQWGTAVLTLVTNLALLAVIWLVVRYGVHATIWWGLRGGIAEFATSLLRLVRFLPLLLIFSIALFYTTEVWQVFDHTPGVSDFILGGFFALLILAILRIRLASETTEILAVARSADDGDDDGADGPGEGPVPGDYTTSQLANVRVMVAMNQLLQVVVVSVLVGTFFFALGTLTITEGVMQAWAVTGGGWQRELTLGGADLLVSQTLLRVSVALATFTGLYYAISVLTDGLYRTDFIDDMAAKMRDVERHRRRYAVALDRARAAGPPV